VSAILTLQRDDWLFLGVCAVILAGCLWLLVRLDERDGQR